MSSRITNVDRGFARHGTFGPGGATGHFFDALVSWHERAQQRRDLRSLDDRLLRDIGVSRAEAEEEARKPFWRR